MKIYQRCDLPVHQSVRASLYLSVCVCCENAEHTALNKYTKDDEPEFIIHKRWNLYTGLGLSLYLSHSLQINTHTHTYTQTHAYIRSSGISLSVQHPHSVITELRPEPVLRSVIFVLSNSHIHITLIFCCPCYALFSITVKGGQNTVTVAHTHTHTHTHTQIFRTKFANL